MTAVAVVTGGAGGMGLATAHILGRSHVVVISDVDPVRLEAARHELTEAGARCVAAVCDITDRDSVRGLVEVAQRSGTVTSVVHAAGVSPTMGSADVIVRINAAGTVIVTEAMLAIARPGMAVVNVASVAGHQLPAAFAPIRSYRRAAASPDGLRHELARYFRLVPRSRRSQLAYVVSKNFVIWYSAAMAAAFGACGARVLSVSPGTFDTTMGRLEAGSGGDDLTMMGALKRVGRPEEIAELLAFCAGSGPGYLAGTDIVCDGGVQAGMSLADIISLARAH